jgi:predicted alpha/beta-hydrolase family hydrolase
MTERFRFQVDGERLTAMVYRPLKPIGATLLLGHGATSGQEGPFMRTYAADLADRGLLVVTYDFPFMAQGRRRPDSDEVLQATCRAAIAAARQCRAKNRLFVGGKSLGGRIAAEVVGAGGDDVSDVAGVVLLGFPLHPIGRRAPSRANLLRSIAKPVLFVQGTRDVFGTADELRPIADGLPQGSEILPIEDGDHSFVLMRDGGRRASRVNGEIEAEIDDEIVRFVERIAPAAPEASPRPLHFARRVSSRVRSHLRAFRRSATA